MYPRQQTYVPNSQVLSADLNGLQDKVASLTPSSGSGNGLLGMPQGFDGQIHCGAVWTNATVVTLDTQLDWHDRMLLCFYRDLGNINRAPGQANDYLFDANALTTAFGYTGKGAKGAAGVAVVSGTPPVPAAGSSWAVKILSNLWVYSDPNNSQHLYVYNNTGADIAAGSLLILFSAQTGKRP